MNTTTLPLSGHPETSLTIEATLKRGGPLWFIDYRVVGDTKGLYWPPLTEENKRLQGLWESTCLEAFFLFEDGSYEEWNFSPSGAWNCFSFSKYRTPQKLVEKVVERPALKNKGTGMLSVAIDSKGRESAQKVNLTAVLKTSSKTTKETLHYFAHSHPKSGPDFHQLDSFYSLDSSSFSLT